MGSVGLGEHSDDRVAAAGDDPLALRDRVSVRDLEGRALLVPEHDALFPQAWADRIEAFFSDALLRLLDGVGHFTPVEAPEVWRTGWTTRSASREAHGYIRQPTRRRLYEASNAPRLRVSGAPRAGGLTAISAAGVMTVEMRAETATT